MTIDPIIIAAAAGGGGALLCICLCFCLCCATKARRETAYDALSAHFARYQSTPSGFATPLPEALVGTIERNVANARRNGRWADRAAAAAAVAASE